MLKIVVLVMLLASLVSISVSNPVSAKTSTVKELKHIKNLAGKGTTIYAKNLEVGDGGDQVKKVFGSNKSIVRYHHGINAPYPKENLIFHLGNKIGNKPKLALIKENKILSIQVNFPKKKSYSYAEIKKVFGKHIHQYVNAINGQFAISYIVKGKFVYFIDSSRKYNPNKINNPKNSTRFQSYSVDF